MLENPRIGNPYDHLTTEKGMEIGLQWREPPQTKQNLFSKEQMEFLQKLINPQHLNTSVIRTGSLVHKGNFLNALKTTRETNWPWIVDSRASDHMTGDARVFNTYSPCLENFTIRIADGSLSRVIGKGSVVVSKNLTLKLCTLSPRTWIAFYYLLINLLMSLIVLLNFFQTREF